MPSKLTIHPIAVQDSADLLVNSFKMRLKLPSSEEMGGNHRTSFPFVISSKIWGRVFRLVRDGNQASQTTNKTSTSFPQQQLDKWINGYWQRLKGGQFQGQMTGCQLSNPQLHLYTKRGITMNSLSSVHLSGR